MGVRRKLLKNDRLEAALAACCDLTCAGDEVAVCWGVNAAIEASPSSSSRVNLMGCPSTVVGDELCVPLPLLPKKKVRLVRGKRVLGGVPHTEASSGDAKSAGGILGLALDSHCSVG